VHCAASKVNEIGQLNEASGYPRLNVERTSDHPSFPGMDKHRNKIVSERVSDFLNRLFIFYRIVVSFICINGQLCLFVCGNAWLNQVVLKGPNE
jgi:hypothetical protein